MSMKRDVLNSLNGLLRNFNLKLDTMTAVHLENVRLREYYKKISSGEPLFPVPQGFLDAKHDDYLHKIINHRQRFESFMSPTENDVGYCFNNDYFTSPDAEILYTIVADKRPSVYLEVGSGNSTRIVRQAIIDCSLDTQIVSIDPCPRVEAEDMCDESHRKKVEEFEPSWFAEKLNPGDILFIDSSHQVKAGNDVVFLLLKVLPLLDAGVIIHIHDIFLPFDYPPNWVAEWGWNEQYLVQACLMGNFFSNVLWAGQYAQRNIGDFEKHFDYSLGSLKSQSLWLEL